MCFEFEALYWAKLAEEEDRRKELEKQRTTETPTQEQPVYDEDPLPV